MAIALRLRYRDTSSVIARHTKEAYGKDRFNVTTAVQEGGLQ